MPLNKFSLLNIHRAPAFGPIGACAYIAGLAVPFAWDIPLVVLALSSVLATVFSAQNRLPASSPLIFPVLGFLVATGLSLLVSEKMGRSVQLSAPLLPAVLLFFLIADDFHGPWHTRLLYLTFSLVGLGLASVLLWTVCTDGWLSTRTWVLDVGSPVLVVPNDVIFLAVVAPLSLALLYRKPRSAVGALAALSILLSVCAVCLLRSRVAILTMIVSLTSAAALVRPRLGFACGLMILILALLVDGLLGFPLAAKFGRIWEDEFSGIREGRMTLWFAAWALFREAPWLGHGLHTFVYTYSDGVTVTWAHNLYLEVLAEQGVIGLAALGWLLACGLSAAWKIQRTALIDTRLLAAGAFAGLVSFCFAASLELSFLRQWVVITLFALVGVIAQLASAKRI